MRLVVLSDTHGFHRGMGEHGNGAVPEGDVLIHCGDYSRDYGSATDTERFATWMGRQPHAHKIVCPGNHDFAVHENPAWGASLFREHGVYMVGQQPLTVDDVVFDGGPWMPISGYQPPFGFEMDNAELEKTWSRVSRGVDVLLSHTPPRGILDKTLRGTHIGCSVLRTHAFRIAPRVHFFGHVHEGRGSYRERGIDFVNVASNTRGTYVRDEINGITHMTMGIRDAVVYEIEK
jgi:Icc-related predicted phosphoesterase